jgi:hypothetical protein
MIYSSKLRVKFFASDCTPEEAEKVQQRKGILKKKLRILTYHFIPNNGASLFALSLQRVLTKCFETWDVKILGYKTPKLFGYELLKLAKPLRNYPFFYLQRYLIFQKFFERHLNIDKNAPMFSGSALMRYLEDQEVAATFVAMDTWNVARWKELPAFPNAYWLPGKLSGKKVAFSVSGYRSHRSELEKQQSQIKHLLDDFDFIGVRDAFTHSFVANSGIESHVPLVRMHDMTVFHDIESVGVKEKLVEFGLDFERPILGLLFFGKPTLSKAMRLYFKEKGYQIVALSMYNPYADINLGHRLDPLEWAEALKFLDFCITDRFHGVLYCLKNNTPFVSIEPISLETPFNSKLLSLLKYFEMEAFYLDPFSNDFKVDKIFEKHKEARNTRDQHLDLINNRLEIMRNENLIILERLKEIISG